MRVYKIWNYHTKSYYCTPKRKTFDTASGAKRTANSKIGKGQFAIHTFKLEMVHNED